jgi:tol-pal system protein YbgF
MNLRREISSRNEFGKFIVGIFAFTCLFVFVPDANASAEIDDILRPGAQLSKTNLPPLRVAQASEASFRVNQLEEQIRTLNGQIEELNFQLLQMQEQMRRMQEDNEFRFQELEGKKQGSLGRKPTRLANKKPGKQSNSGKPLPSESTVANSISGGNAIIAKSSNRPRMIDGVEIYQPNSAGNTISGPQAPLGTITFDPLGNVVDSALGKPVDLSARARQPDTRGNDNREVQSQTDFASVGSAEQLYDLGYEYFQAGDYVSSQQAFTEFVERYGDDIKISNAQFWLGESLFSQGDFEGAAKIFLDTHTNWPEARIAPQALLKLGISLAGMQQRELACATYAKVLAKYPGTSKAMKKRVKAEQKASSCLNG